jgi:hypothetical protein
MCMCFYQTKPAAARKDRTHSILRHRTVLPTDCSQADDFVFGRLTAAFLHWDCRKQSGNQMKA